MRSLYVRQWSHAQPREVVRRQWLEAQPKEHQRAADAWLDELSERLDITSLRRGIEIRSPNAGLLGLGALFIGGMLLADYGARGLRKKVSAKKETT